MKVGAKITVPKFVNELKDYNQNPYYSFLYNVSVKNKQTGEYEIKERYSINVMNIFVEENMEIQITKILDAKPKVTRSKNGQDYLNCLLYVEADNVTNYNEVDKALNDIPPKNNDIYDDSEDDLPF